MKIRLFFRRVLLLPFVNYRNFVKSSVLPNDFWPWFMFKLGINKIYWPKDKTCLVSNSRKIYVGKCSKIGRPGSYIQGKGGVYIGDFVRFGPNVGISRDSRNISKNNLIN